MLKLWNRNAGRIFRSCPTRYWKCEHNFVAFAPASHVLRTTIIQTTSKEHNKKSKNIKECKSCQGWVPARAQVRRTKKFTRLDSDQTILQRRVKTGTDQMKILLHCIQKFPESSQCLILESNEVKAVCKNKSEDFWVTEFPDKII